MRASTGKAGDRHRHAHEQREDVNGTSWSTGADTAGATGRAEREGQHDAGVRDRQRRWCALAQQGRCRAQADEEHVQDHADLREDPS
jgi:hypothetical protein